jgi:hypothetical protein
VETIIKDNLEQDTIKLNSHLTLNLLDGLKPQGAWWPKPKSLASVDCNFCPWVTDAATHIDPTKISVLLKVMKTPKHCEIGFPGGRRSLAETPLECALRHTKEGINMDLNDAPVRGPDQNVVTQHVMTHDWLLSLHLKLILNCYIYCHRSMFL